MWALVKFEVFTAEKVLIEVFWFVTPCNVAVGYQSSGGQRCLRLHFTLRMKAANSSETLIFYCSTTRRHNKEELEL
jgi:hypothetical protein